MPISKHEDKMVNLQVQLRQNQSELQDYLAGLDNWETDIKEKEAQLSSTQHKTVSNLPPVRNTIHKKKLKKKKKEKSIEPNKPNKISGYDFQAWDKFDVDKALEEVDNEKNETSSSEYETDEEWELERKIHLAGQEKDKGNAHLKNGDFSLAVEAYTRGMEFDPTNAILPANRAMAFLKQQKFASAELDCTTSISLDPLYVKAYLRRATARAGLGKLHDAITDFNRVLDLEPTNKQAKTEIERMQKELEREKDGPVTTTLTEGERGRVKPIYKPPEERSKKALFRVAIEEIGLETKSRPTPAVGQSDLTKKIVDKEKKEFDKLFSGKLSSETTSHVQPSDTRECLDSSNTVNPPVAQTDTKSGQSSDEICDGSRMVKPTFSVPQSDTKSGQSSEEICDGSRTVKPTFSVPQSSFQFQSDFQVLKDKPEAFVQYFKAISPCDYCQLFGQSFDGDILVTILTTLEAFSDRVDLYHVLNCLSQVKRFSMAAMFMSPKDKEVARKLLDKLKESNSEQQVAALRKKYDL